MTADTSNEKLFVMATILAAAGAMATINSIWMGDRLGAVFSGGVLVAMGLLSIWAGIGMWMQKS